MLAFSFFHVFPSHVFHLTHAGTNTGAQLETNTHRCLDVGNAQVHNMSSQSFWPEGISSCGMNLGLAEALRSRCFACSRCPSAVVASEASRRSAFEAPRGLCWVQFQGQQYQLCRPCFWASELTRILALVGHSPGADLSGEYQVAISALEQAYTSFLPLDHGPQGGCEGESQTEAEGEARGQGDSCGPPPAGPRPGSGRRASTRSRPRSRSGRGTSGRGGGRGRGGSAERSSRRTRRRT